MLRRFRGEVVSTLNDALALAGFEAGDLEVGISEHADLASSVAFKLASGYKMSPADAAERIAGNIQLPEKNSLIDHVLIVGPYINFFVNKLYIEETIDMILRDGMDFASLGMSGRIILEHTSANPNGPLHVGHIRNSIIGDTLARILRKAGYDVETQYYVNDMGRQMAMVVWGMGKFRLDDDKKGDHAAADVYVAANRLLEEQPELKSEVDLLMQQYENGDAEVVKMFKNAVALGLKGIGETLTRMNVRHDKFVWESQFVLSGDVEEVLRDVKGSKYYEIKDDAAVLNLEKFGFEKEMVLQRSDGTSLYVTRDLAYHRWKSASCDMMIDVFGADHKLISSQLSAVLNIMNIPQPRIVIFEFVSLPEGSMSTRAGKFISADQLLDEVEKQAYVEVDSRRDDVDDEFKKQTARNVGIGAVRYDIIRVSPDKSTVFDWKSALDFEKRGAPFIQYSHARACSILAKARSEGIGDYIGFDPSLIIDEREIVLVKKLAMMSFILESCVYDLKPHTLAVYAREVAEEFNQFYRDVPVISAESKYRMVRLAITDCVRIVLQILLDLLGIDAPESM